MIKSSELVIVVDSVEEAVKFYTEKLAFDLIDAQASKENQYTLLSAHIRRGKCYITFRTPYVEELAEFSFIKRCASRCIGLYIEMKKGIDTYFERCQKKDIRVLSEPKNTPDGYRSFSLRDPFGNKLTFAQMREQSTLITNNDFLGMSIDLSKNNRQSELVMPMVEHLRKFGILRRASKKFAKLKLKQCFNKKNKK